MKSPTILAVTLAAGLSSACVVTPEPGRLSPEATSAAPVARSMEVATDPVLYARDGTPVRAASSERFAQGSVPDEPAHGVRRGEQSRMYLLELYQEAIDQKEAFELEARSMQVDLQLAREETLSLKSELGGARTRIAELESEGQRQREELRELAQRLVTAQIRRLESDKLLLEAKIEWARTRQMIESGARDGAPANGAAR